jgi:hypothetical protein
LPVSHQYGCTFVHVPKTGGTSIEYALEMRPDSKREDLRTLFGRIESSALKSRGFLTGYLQHLTAEQIRELDPELLGHRYFSFAMVRNPWARMVSSFTHKDPHLLREARARAIELEKISFPDYVWQTGRLQHAHLQSQCEYVHDAKGQLLVDFVGRFESLTSDFQKVCRRLGIEKQLPAKKQSKQKISNDYHDYYDDETRAAVASRYAQDIECFGYSF